MPTKKRRRKRKKNVQAQPKKDVYDYARCKREFMKKVRYIGRSYDTYRVFADFVTLAAMAQANAIDFSQEREDAYLATVKRYSPEDARTFGELMGIVALALEVKSSDFLGTMYQEMGLANADGGQFFTPEHLCNVLADLNLDREHVDPIIKKRGYVSVSDPACGSGNMLIAAFHRIAQQGVDVHHRLWLHGQDVSTTAAYMCYVQLALLGAGAVVVVGNTLSTETRETLITPGYYMFNWAHRLRYGGTKKRKRRKTGKGLQDDKKKTSPGEDASV